MNSEEPPSIKTAGIVTTLAIIILLTHPVQADVSSPQEVPLSSCFLEDTQPIYTEYREENKELIDCLAKHESTSNPEAINWNDNGSPSWGLLQFKRSTYNYYCVNKYGLPDDIMNPSYQRECADRIISAGGLSHWSTRNKCL